MPQMNKPLLLDLFCGAGGAAMGYHRAGFDVVGVDIEPQPKYPFEFYQGDALEFCRKYGKDFDVIHASPVCKGYSIITRSAGTSENYPDQVPETREVLISTGKCYVIENVPGAPLKNYVVLCGTMFGLNVIRHRLFECNPGIYFSPACCNHHKRVVKHGRRPDREKHFAAVTGHFTDTEFGRAAMGIDWMVQKELSQAIPPAYTKWIGEQILPNVKS